MKEISIYIKSLLNDDADTNATYVMPSLSTFSSQTVKLKKQVFANNLYNCVVINRVRNRSSYFYESNIMSLLFLLGAKRHDRCMCVCVCVCGGGLLRDKKHTLTTRFHGENVFIFLIFVQKGLENFEFSSK